MLLCFKQAGLRLCAALENLDLEIVESAAIEVVPFSSVRGGIFRFERLRPVRQPKPEGQRQPQPEAGPQADPTPSTSRSLRAAKRAANRSADSSADSNPPKRPRLEMAMGHVLQSAVVPLHRLENPMKEPNEGQELSLQSPAFLRQLWQFQEPENPGSQVVLFFT